MATNPTQNRSTYAVVSFQFTANSIFLAKPTLSRSLLTKISSLDVPNGLRTTPRSNTRMHEILKPCFNSVVYQRDWVRYSLGVSLHSWQQHLDFVLRNAWMLWILQRCARYVRIFWAITHCKKGKSCLIGYECMPNQMKGTVHFMMSYSGADRLTISHID